jgi:metallo-beta-lactamase family protein
LGRKIVEGAKKVKIFGEEVSVNAEIQMIEGFSGHADMDGLMEWLGGFTKFPATVFITHGEEDVMDKFAMSIKAKFGAMPLIPGRHESFEVLPTAEVKVVEPPAPVLAVTKDMAALRNRIEMLRSQLNEIFEMRGLTDADIIKLKGITDELEPLVQKYKSALK